MVAYNDSYSVASGQILSVSSPGVQANDTNSNFMFPASSNVIGNPQHGSLSISPSGGFTYNPFLGFSGTDAWTYQNMAGPDFSNIATVTITVTSLTPTVTSLSPTSAVVGGTLSTPC